MIYKLCGRLPVFYGDHLFWIRRFGCAIILQEDERDECARKLQRY